MNDFVFSPEARDDLQEIWCYIARDNPGAADRLEADIYAACEKLARQPRLGHRRKDLTSEPVLFWRVRNVYLIVYLQKTPPLSIVRILHGTRDIPAELE